MEQPVASAGARLADLFDEGTFAEIGTYVRRGAEEGRDAVLCGYGSVNGKPAFAFAQDAGRTSGALDAAGAAKIEALYRRAVDCGAPVVALFGGAGAAVSDGPGALDAYGRVMRRVSDASGIIPQVACVAGVCGGMAAVIASLFDFTIISEGTASLYVAPPNLAGRETGTPAYALARGLASVGTPDVPSAIAAARELVTLLPRHNRDVADGETEDDPNRPSRPEGLSGRALIAELADDGRMFPLYEGYAREIALAFARLGGRLVGVAASDASANGGRLTPEGARKTARLVSFCDAFAIPFVTLADSEGLSAEGCPGAAPAYARLAAAYASAACARVTAVTGKAYGAAFTLLGSRALGADLTLALPGAVVSVLPPESAVAFLWNDRVAGAEDRRRLEREWERNSTAAEAAACGAIDDVIPAEELRARLISALRLLEGKAVSAPVRRRPVLPL